MSNAKDSLTRYNRAMSFLLTFNESEEAAALPIEVKRQAFLDAEHAAATDDHINYLAEIAMEERFESEMERW